MPEKIMKDNESEKVVRYYCSLNSAMKCLFYILPDKSKITMFFSSEVLDCLFLSSKKKSFVYIVLKDGVVGINFPLNISYSFVGNRLVFQLHSVDLFEELVDLTFYNCKEINFGCTSENKFNGMGLFVTSKRNEENSSFEKLRNLPCFSFISFLIHDEEKDFWGIKIPIVKSENFSDGLLLENVSYKKNFRNILAFYLNSPQQSKLFFSGKSFKDNKNLFLIFLFASYIFYENDLCHKIFSFSGDLLFSVLRVREEFDFYITVLTEKKLLITRKNFYPENEENGFFIGDNCFLFFNLKKFYKSQKGKDEFFLLNDKCFISNRNEYFDSVHKDWGIALLPGVCVPIRKGKKYHLMVYPQNNGEIQFEYKTAKISVMAYNNKIELSYNFPLLEKIFVIISPSKILKIKKNGEYAPLIVKKKCDYVELNCDENGKMEIYLN